MDAVPSSETSVNVYKTMRWHNLGDSIRYFRSCFKKEINCTLKIMLEVIWVESNTSTSMCLHGQQNFDRNSFLIIQIRELDIRLFEVKCLPTKIAI
jgi:hypothetical protein